MATPPLFVYAQALRRLIGYDENFALFSEDDLNSFISIARQEVAAQGQCIRRLSPCQGSIYTLDVTNPGSGYTAPTLTISAPDAPSGSKPYPQGLQATGDLQIIGGQISNASVVIGGAGYFQPTVTINDATGSGAVITPTLTPLWQTNVGQEEYAFSDIPLAGFPGISSVLAIRSITIFWGPGNWQWSCGRVSFSKYQALYRQYSTQWLAPPVIACQFGQGIEGTYKLYPIADQAYPQQVDCICLPADLEDDTSYEAIPVPWRNAVPFYAAHLALLSKAAEVPQMLPLALQYFNETTGGLFMTHMRRARAFSQPGYVSSYYGRL